MFEHQCERFAVGDIWVSQFPNASSSLGRRPAMIYGTFYTSDARVAERAVQCNLMPPESSFESVCCRPIVEQDLSRSAWAQYDTSSFLDLADSIVICQLKLKLGSQIFFFSKYCNFSVNYEHRQNFSLALFFFLLVFLPTLITLRNAQA